MSFFSRLDKLATCLEKQIEADNRPSLAHIGVMPGELALSDYAFGDSGDGMGWVRMMSMSPVSGVGITNTAVGNCSSEVGQGIEMGILRCFSVGDDSGDPPPFEEQRLATIEQMEDAATMYRAIVCCLPSKDYVLGSYRPAGPMGGVYGGIWTLQTVAD